MNRSVRTGARPMVVAALFVTAALLAGCAGGSAPDSSGAAGGNEGEPVKGGNLNVAIAADPQSLDMVVSYTPQNASVAGMVYDNLWELDEEYDPQPSLIAEETVSDDGLVYDIVLRDDVTWHDGDPLLAEDAVASIERYLRISGTGQTVAPQFEAVEVVDDHAFQIRLTKPRYGLEAEFSVEGTEIFKKADLEAAGDLPVDKSRVNGTGPYKLQEWGADRVVLERWDEYVSRTEDPSGAAGAKAAYYDTITYRFISDPSAILSALQTGEVDLGSVVADFYDQVSDDPNLEVRFSTGNGLATLTSNAAESSVFSDPEARRALSLAFDKQAFLATQGLDKELALEDGAWVPKELSRLYSEEWQEGYAEYDPDEAKAIFEELGIDKIRVTTSQTIPALHQMAVILKDNLSEIGVEAELQVLDFGTMLVTLQEQPDTWDLSTLLFAGISATPPTAVIHTRPWGSFQTPELVGLLEDYSASTSDDEARTVVDEIQAYMWRDRSNIIVGQTRSFSVTTSRMQGYMFGLNYANTWLAEN